MRGVSSATANEKMQFPGIVTQLDSSPDGLPKRSRELIVKNTGLPAMVVSEVRRGCVGAGVAVGAGVVGA